jgi:hypothetical protein
MSLNKRINLQIAADDLSTIADTVDDLGKLLDKFHATHGTELYERLEKAWPAAVEFGGTASKPLHDLASQLEPRE